MSFTGNEDHTISLVDAGAMTQAYRDSTGDPEARKGVYFGKDAIEAILSQTGCVGIRFYFAHDDEGKLSLVLVGADANENDLHTGTLAEFGLPCPKRCASANPLNS